MLGARRSRGTLAVLAALAALPLVLAVAAGTAARAPGRAAPAVVLRPQVVVLGARGASGPPTTQSCLQNTGGTVACYDPAQLRKAYDLAPLYAAGQDGRGETIVVVDAFGSPTIRSDLAAFDRAFSLPAPPSFRIITPTGTPPAYTPSGKDRFAWASETSLDVEWAHALAPGASILLVETPTDEVEGTTGFPDIVRAEHYVLDHHLGQVISQSFGATEQTFAGYGQLAPLRSAYVSAAADHVTVLGGSGDLGATDFKYNAVDIYPYRVTSWPASDPLVTAIGGTRLDLSSSGKVLAPAVAWNDTYSGSRPYPEASGGGRSVFFARPSFQSTVHGVVGTARGVPDVSMSAACTGVVDVYVSAAAPGRGPPGWYPMCGTSEATPLFAAIVAIADQRAGHALGDLNPALYAMLASKEPGLVPVTLGNNTVAFSSKGKTVTVRGFTASAGYNLVTGVGTIDAARFVPELVAEVAHLD